jgi:putative tryptophan/tyrosine transport system substrate-binding protein
VRRREFIALTGGVAAWPHAVWSQQEQKTLRIGVLETISRALNAAQFDALRQGLARLGYVEGRNIAIEYRSTDGHQDRFENLAIELVRLNVDIIVTRGTPAALAAKKTTNTIPIVMTGAGDPVATGIVASLSRPGGNVTGLSGYNVEVYSKRVQLLRELVPRLARIGGLFNMANPVLPLQWKEVEEAGRTYGVATQLHDVRRPDDLERAFEAAANAQRVDAVVVALDGLMQANQRRIIELAAKYRMPATYGSGEFVYVGGLMAYTVDFRDLYGRAAVFVDRIAKGAKPADLPVEQPTKFELVINLKTARALGLTIPPTLLARADEVIE